MILGVGIDTVQVERFSGWANKSLKSLNRIFSSEEIAYALACPTLSAQRFAVRFAAKEAFYKAFTQATGQHRPLLEIVKKVSVAPGGVQLQVDGSIWPQSMTNIYTHLSLTHSGQQGVALVIIESFEGQER